MNAGPKYIQISQIVMKIDAQDEYKESTVKANM